MDRKLSLKIVRERAEPWDVVIIGGGATGIGCALDAATRGLSVLLVERDDLGKHTSSRSTKLVHGGVRYLAQGDISLVREALHERGLLLKNGPHTVHKLEFIVPCRNLWEKIFYGTGLKIYDILAGNLSFGRSRSLSKSETLNRLPGLDPAVVSGGISYWDGQFDDARLLIDIASTASENGACILNYARVDALSLNKEKIRNITISDMVGRETLSVQALSVINAAGAFADPIRKMSDADAKPVIMAARGSHIILPLDLLSSGSALMIPKTPDGRVLFCIPWLGRLLVGTTDVPCSSPEQGEIPTNDEIDFLLDTAGQYLIKKPKRDDIISSFAGVRPLVRQQETQTTAKLSRSHELFIDNGLITITGGKWTTYRRMAEDAVDAAVKYAGLRATRCITQDLTIGPPAACDEIERAIDQEMAQTIEDVLLRRMRALLIDPDSAKGLATQAADRLAKKSGWSEKEKITAICEFEKVFRQYTGDQSLSADN